MENLNFLAPLLMISGVAVIVLAIIAVVQDIKQERKYGYRQAFYTIVTLVMLVMAVGSSVSLIVIGLKEAMPSAKTFTQRNDMPPAPYLTGISEKTPPPLTTYSCTSSCDFSEADKQNFNEWKTQYNNWKESGSSSLQLRRELAGALALFLVSLPLYWLFMRWMNRGAQEEAQQHQRPSPLRSVYFYGIAFGGLVMAVVGGAMLLNTVLKVAFKTGSSVQIATPAMVGSTSIGADSVIACSTKCGFTADDVALVNKWKSDNAAALERQSKNTGTTTNDIANSLPYVIVGFPLFWLHFAKIRKDTQNIPASSAPTV